MSMEGYNGFWSSGSGGLASRCRRSRGTLAEVYLENLVPLFYIEQQDGWTDLQARQVTRYAQQQIAQISVEYLLGATDAVESRVTRQMALLRRCRSSREDPCDI